MNASKWMRDRDRWVRLHWIDFWVGVVVLIWMTGFGYYLIYKHENAEKLDREYIATLKSKPSIGNIDSSTTGSVNSSAIGDVDSATTGNVDSATTGNVDSATTGNVDSKSRVE